jgi:hypothetical protein
LNSALESSTVACTLTAEHFALPGRHFLEGANILVINKSGTRATFLGAKTTTILLTFTQFLANHGYSQLFVNKKSNTPKEVKLQF